MAVTVVRLKRNAGKPAPGRGVGFFGFLFIALSFFLAGYIYSATTDGNRVLRNCVAEFSSGGVVDGQRVATCLDTFKSTGVYRWVHESVTNLSLLPLQGIDGKMEAVGEFAREQGGNIHERETARVGLIMAAR